MHKTVYYSKKYNAIQMAEINNETPIVRAVPKHRSNKASAVILGVCLLVALLLVMVVPTLAGGAEAPAGTATAPKAEATARNVVEYDSIAAAKEAAGIAAATPTSLPEGMVLTGCSVVDGSMVELALYDGHTGLVLRVAAGSEDLSGKNIEEYAYICTETVDGVAREYAGSSNMRFSLAVWANGGYSYAIVAEDDMDPDVLRQLAEDIL